MKYTDKIYHKVSDFSYSKLKKDNTYKILGQDYKVIEKRDDTQNGLRAYVSLQ